MYNWAIIIDGGMLHDPIMRGGDPANLRQISSLGKLKVSQQDPHPSTNLANTASHPPEGACNSPLQAPSPIDNDPPSGIVNSQGEGKSFSLALFSHLLKWSSAPESPQGSSSRDIL